MRRWLIHLVIVWVMVLSCARTMLFMRRTDLGFDDESGYLWDGLNFFGAWPHSGEGSPLYALWYKLESLFINDPVTLYQANWGILLFLTLIMLAVALRTVGVSIVGTVLTLSYALIATYFDVWPYVTLLSGVLVLVAAILILRGKTPGKAYGAAAAVLAIAVFVRPEFLLSFLLTLSIAGFTSLREREPQALILPLVIFGVLCLAFGMPFGGGRSMQAFGQHYAMNVAQSLKFDVDFWNNWRTFVQADFGDAQTPLGALSANPRALLWHMMTNAKNLADGTIPLLEPNIFSLKPGTRSVVGKIMALLLAVGTIRGLTHAGRDESGRRLVLLLAAILVPYLASALLIAPRLHYFMAPLTVLCVLAGFGLSKTKHSLPMLLLLIVPLPLISMVYDWHRPAHGRPGLATVQALRALDAPAQGNILESEFGMAIYANLNYTHLGMMKCSPFAECLRLKHPKIIVVDNRLRNHYYQDGNFHALVKHPEAFGFDVTHVQGTRVDIYVSRQ